MTRTRIILTTAAVLATSAGCGAAVAAPPAPSPSASTSAKPAPEHRHARPYLRRNTLHGEIVVKGKDGNRTVVVQRGTVLATDARTLRVKSADGFTLTWTRDGTTRVRGTLATGAEVGVRGHREGAATVAGLVVVK